jgi:hemolysin activation/secretion protein
MRRKSPLQPPTGEQPGSLLDMDSLTRCRARLNRHPGRRVEAAVSATSETGEATLDYLVAESRPWMVYAQLLNTGTEVTDEWRQRVGFIDHQLFGFDDILSFDYLTAGFGSASNAVSLSYGFPVAGYDRLRLRPFAVWSQYTADEVGASEEDFEGESYSLGGELAWNFFQSGPLFLDAVLGLRWEHQQVENETFAELFPTEDFEGEGEFLIPHAGLRLARSTGRSNTHATVTLEGNVGSIDEDELSRLGRLQTDEDWVALHWDAGHSFSIESLIERIGKKTPTDSNAHELSLQCSGQWTVDGSRLAPQYQAVAGGFFSVRGYEESIVAGDNLVLANVEYRFHIGAARQRPAPGQTPEERGHRALRLNPRRVGVPQEFGLTLRAFFDAGHVSSNDALDDEADGLLLGCGIGAELQVFRYLNLRCDWGVALADVEDKEGDVIEDAESGNSRLHVMATLVW